MRRLIISLFGGVIILNIVGMSIFFTYLYNYDKEVKRTIIINKSILLRTEVRDKSRELLSRMKESKTGEVIGLASEIKARLWECNECHHRDNTLAWINDTREKFEKVTREIEKGRKINFIDLANVVGGLEQYAFRKAKESALAQTISLNVFRNKIKGVIVMTTGLTIVAFMLFSIYMLKKGTSLEREIKEKERVITDWGIEWQNTFDAMEDMVIVLDEDYKPGLYNTSAVNFFGPNLLMKDFLSFLNISMDELKESLSRTLKINDRIFSLRSYPLCETGRKGIMVFRDITKERELEDKLNRAERLASLGIMAGGIAHEIKNPLSPIIGYAELLYDIEKDEKKREYLGIINSAAQRIDRIVKDMLFLAREGNINTSDVNIGEVVKKKLK